jgi:transposase InsO family protein
MAEAFVKTFKRDYVYLADIWDAETVLGLLPTWFADYNHHHPHKGLKMMSPTEFPLVRRFSVASAESPDCACC